MLVLHLYALVHPIDNASATSLVYDMTGRAQTPLLATSFCALADKAEWPEEGSKRRARKEVPWSWDRFDEDERLW